MYAVLVLAYVYKTAPISGGSKNFEEGRKTINQPVLIYRKCTQRSIGLLHRKRRLLGEKIETIKGAAVPIATPFQSATGPHAICLYCAVTPHSNPLVLN